MKGYENVTRTSLTKRTPVIIRIDGRAFHTYTKHVVSADPITKDTPFSGIMHTLMVATARELVQEVQGCVLAYTQSDEISLLLKDWTTIETQAWFDNLSQKMCSVSAAIATMAFNKATQSFVGIRPTATFDARVFNIPPAEVCNYFIWRQQDATRNSVQMYARHYFSHKELHGKSNANIMDMLMLEKGVNWNDLPTWCRRGTCIITSSAEDDSPRMSIDENIPIFTQDRTYINKWLEE